jgi:hypothetical protein
MTKTTAAPKAREPSDIRRTLDIGADTDARLREIAARRGREPCQP